MTDRPTTPADRRPAPAPPADRRARRLAATALVVAAVALVGWGATSVALVAATRDDVPATATATASAAAEAGGGSGASTPRSVADVA